MRAVGWGLLFLLFGGGGVVSGIIRLSQSRHVEPIGMALLALMALGGIVLIRLGIIRARAAARRRPEVAVLDVAKRHGGRVTAVLVAAETGLSIDVAERELSSQAERGVCVRRTDDGASYFLFPELESEDVKRELFFSDAQPKRAQGEQKVRS